MECIATAHIHLYCMFAHGLVIAPVTASVRTCMLESFLTTFCGGGVQRELIKYTDRDRSIHSCTSVL